METYALNVGKASVVAFLSHAHKQSLISVVAEQRQTKPIGSCNYTSHMGGWMRGLDLTACTSHAHNHLLVSGVAEWSALVSAEHGVPVTTVKLSTCRHLSAMR